MNVFVKLLSEKKDIFFPFYLSVLIYIPWLVLNCLSESLFFFKRKRIYLFQYKKKEKGFSHKFPLFSFPFLAESKKWCIFDINKSFKESDEKIFKRKLVLQFFFIS